MFTIQLPSMLWPTIQTESSAANQSPTYYLGQQLQKVLLKKMRAKK